MPSKSTCYLVGERLTGGGTAWLATPISPTGHFGWTAMRSRAQRFTGRAEADQAAQQLDAALKARGHKRNRIVVVPAMGGVACGRRAVVAEAATEVAEVTGDTGTMHF